MRAHTITTKPPVGGRGRTTRAIVPGAIVALSLAVVLLAATASTASAARSLGPWYCPPLTPPPTTLEQVPPGCFGLWEFDLGPGAALNFDFGDRQLGTTSPVQRFALGVGCYPKPCNETFNPSIGVSGNYAQTNSCPATLSANYPGQLQGCLINVTFTPTGTGPKAGTLSTGPGGPTATLTGNGVTHATPPALPCCSPCGTKAFPPCQSGRRRCEEAHGLRHD